MSTEKSIEDQIGEKRQFEALASGSVYKLPTYKIVPGKGIQKTGRTQFISFVRGSKIDGENEFPPVEGVVHETLLSMMLHDLNLKNQEVPNEYTPEVIKHLGAARDIMEQRIKDRHERNVLGTYKD